MATLKDVAKETGLTTSTVSRVLNNRGYISDHTRKKVEEAIKKLNYRPNEAARSLQSKSTNTIGLIVPHIYHPYFGKLIDHLEEQAYERGYKVWLLNTHSTYEKEEEYIRLCVSNKVAGIVLCSGTAALEIFDGIDIPVITIERFLDNGTAAVECDNMRGGALAAEKLIACGCNHLLYVGNISNHSMPADLRLTGFREVCEREGVPFVEFLTDHSEYFSMQYGEKLDQMIQENPETDGIFANSDVIAAQALQACRRLHIPVPEQIKVIGFDDVNVAELTTPQLTTLHQPVKEMAEIAVQLLHDAVNGKLVANRTVLPVRLVERESTS